VAFCVALRTPVFAHDYALELQLNASPGP
jgi:hypothetical protein